MLSNSDKNKRRGLIWPSPKGKRDFSNLIASADVLLENLKAGSLERLGFSPEGTSKNSTHGSYIVPSQASVPTVSIPVVQPSTQSCRQCQVLWI